MGIKLINLTCEYAARKYGYKMMAKFSSLPVFKAMIKQRQWKFLGEKRLLKRMDVGSNMGRKSGFRENGVRTFHFEMIVK